jgi:PilZ domain
MLEFDNGQKIMDELWEATPAKVELPDSLRPAYFSAQGPEPLFHDNRRSYHRFFMRGKAVLKRGPSMIGTYTKDVSRQGVAFLSPVPLLPKERVKLRVPATELSLEVTRCRRLDPKCFECGAKFAL